MKTYFYKRKDGSIFACYGQEAFLIHEKYEQVGVSDGEEYQKIFGKTKNVKKAFNAELKAAKGNLERPPDVTGELHGVSSGDREKIARMIYG